MRLLWTERPCATCGESTPHLRERVPWTLGLPWLGLTIGVVVVMVRAFPPTLVEIAVVLLLWLAPAAIWAWCRPIRWTCARCFAKETVLDRTPM